MIEDALTNSTWTSASPGFTNTIKAVSFTFDADIAAGLDDTIQDTDTGQKVGDTTETVDKYKLSGVDEISRMTKSQVSNLTAFATNPFGFVIGSLTKGLVRGVGVIALMIAIGKLIETVIGELMQPGRLFDVRFRETAQQEILKFTLAQEQAEIRQGFRQIIVTTIGGLRGDAAIGQIGGNFYNREAIPINRIDPNPIPASPSSASQGLGSPIVKGFAGQGNARTKKRGIP